MTDLIKRLHDAANKSRDEAWRPLGVTSESMALNAALAELDAAGYAIVPKLPTAEMLNAAYDVTGTLDDVCLAMIKAAPKLVPDA